MRKISPVTAIQQPAPNRYGAAQIKLVFGILLPCLMLLIVLSLSFTLEGSQQFSKLSQAFLHGHLNFLSPIGGAGQDPVYWHGRIYWSEGPLPAVILMPFVGIFEFFHLFYDQGYLTWLLILGIANFIYRLARKFNYTKRDSLILMLGFILGSVFIGVASVSSSWLFAQTITTFLLFWSLYEFFHKKRWWLLGIICGCIFLTRVTAAPIILFYGLELYQTRQSWGPRARLLGQLSLPFAAAILLMGLYNYLRFQSPFNNGSSYQLLGSDSAEARSYGVFSFIHVPTNLYSLILRAPQPVSVDYSSWTLKFPFITSNPYGISMFFTSPYLLYLLTKQWRSFDAQMRRLLIAIIVSVLMVLCYFGIGMDQYGYRYSLDFLPPLYVLFMLLYKKHSVNLTRGMKTLLIGACYLNFILVWSFLF